MARSFAVYYGYGPVDGLEAFDLLILEPAGWRQQDLEALDAHRSRSRLAYLSVLEAGEHVCRQARLTRDDLLHCGGRPWYKEEFATWVVDPRSSRWRAYLRARIRELAHAGWDGLFVDTVGDVEDAAVQGMAHWLLPAAADLMAFVRGEVGRGYLVQNSGLFLLLPMVSQMLDGICLESFPVDGDGTERPLRLALESVLKEAALYGLVPMLLASVPAGPDEAAAVARLQAIGHRYGCITYAAPGDYTSGMRLPDGRIVRPRGRV